MNSLDPHQPYLTTNECAALYMYSLYCTRFNHFLIYSILSISQHKDWIIIGFALISWCLDYYIKLTALKP